MDYLNPNQNWLPPGYDPYKGMSDEERLRPGCLQTMITIGIILLGFLACALFGSCTTTRYVPVMEHRTDTVIQKQTVRDSIRVTDSTVVYQRGDTVFKDKWHTEWRDRWQHDTTYVSRTDTVPMPYPVIKEVPAQLSWWQQTRLHLANILLWALLIAAALWIVRRKFWR